MNDTISRQVEKSYKYSEKQLLHFFHVLQEKHVKAAKEIEEIFSFLSEWTKKERKKKKRYLKVL